MGKKGDIIIVNVVSRTMVGVMGKGVRSSQVFSRDMVELKVEIGHKKPVGLTMI